MTSHTNLSNTTVDTTGPVQPVSLLPRRLKIVLVVDDDPATLLLCTGILAKCGCTWLSADGPLRAIELFERYGPLIDLLVTDTSMREMSGLQLAKALRKWNPRLPVLFMSAASGKEARLKGFTFIEKPFAVEAFVQRVEASLTGSGGFNWLYRFGQDINLVLEGVTQKENRSC